jgi:hypothetical protein
MGDGPGRTDRALIMRSCTEDGSLLQPVKPLTGIDALYDGRDRPAGGFAAAGGAQVWTTYSEIAAKGIGGEDGYRAAAPAVYHLLLSIDVEGPYTAVDTEQDFFPGFSAPPPAEDEEQEQQHVVFIWEHDVAMRCVNGSAAVASGCCTTTMPALDDSPRPYLHHLDSHKWSLLHVMPVLAGGWVFLGELGSKWVPAAASRFSDFESNSEGLTVVAKCTPGEILRVGALKPVREPGASIAGAAASRDWAIVLKEVGCGNARSTAVAFGR